MKKNYIIVDLPLQKVDFINNHINKISMVSKEIIEIIDILEFEYLTYQFVQFTPVIKTENKIDMFPKTAIMRYKYPEEND